MKLLRNMNPFVRNLLVLVAIAVLIVVLNQEVALAAVGTLVGFVFFIAIGVVIYFLWRDFGRREIALWPSHAQWTFYLAGGLLLVDAGWWIVTGPRGRDLLAAILTAAAAIVVGWRTWRRQQQYA